MRKEFGVRINQDLLKWIREQAVEQNRSTSNLIEYVCMLYKRKFEKRLNNAD